MPTMSKLNCWLNKQRQYVFFSIEKKMSLTTCILEDHLEREVACYPNILPNHVPCYSQLQHIHCYTDLKTMDFNSTLRSVAEGRGLPTCPGCTNALHVKAFLPHPKPQPSQVLCPGVKGLRWTIFLHLYAFQGIIFFPLSYNET